MSPDRRAHVRHPSSQPALFRSSTAGPNTYWVARCYNLSLAGIGLLSGFHFPPGARLTIDLPARSAGPPLEARVVHATPREGGWLLGCKFDEALTEDELRGLLAG